MAKVLGPSSPFPSISLSKGLLGTVPGEGLGIRCAREISASASSAGGQIHHTGFSGRKYSGEGTRTHG